MYSDSDQHWMQRALAMARQAEVLGEVPVGAVLVKDGQLLAEACNQPISLHDPTAHAEILVLRQAAQATSNYRLVNTELFVTIEPCIMCAGAMLHARVERLVFAAREPKAGAVCSHLQLFQEPHLNHNISVDEGLLAEESRALIQQFFKRKRQA